MGQASHWRVSALSLLCPCQAEASGWLDPPPPNCIRRACRCLFCTEPNIWPAYILGPPWLVQAE